MRNKPISSYILTGCFILLAASANGQKLNTGIFGGITASEVDGDSYSGFNKIGVTAGAFVNQYIEWDIYWQAEIRYVIKGVYKGPSDNDPTLYRSGYHCIEIPLSVHYLFDHKLQVELGISPEVLVGFVIWDENGKIDPSAYPDNRLFGLSVFGGLGYWFNSSTGLLIRYTNSAIPFRDPEEWNHARYRGYFHNVVSLSLAYKFGQR